MTRHVSTLAAVLALTASVGVAMPASAATHKVRHAARARLATNHAYRVGFNRGFRAGQADVAREVTTGRSAATGQPIGQPYGQVAYGQQQGGYGGPFNNGGLLGTGLFDGQGLLGTGVLGGQGALGLGILGF